MGRLNRFDEHRFIGTRDTMWVYDCDNESQFEELQARVESDSLFARDLLQTFGPDTLDEARNRSFRPVRLPTAR